MGLSHTVGSILSENPRRFTINVGLNTTYQYRKNVEIYFNPAENVGLGTTVVGIGSVLTFSNYGLNSLGLNTTGSRNVSVQLVQFILKIKSSNRRYFNIFSKWRKWHRLQ